MGSAFIKNECKISNITPFMNVFMLGVHEGENLGISIFEAVLMLIYDSNTFFFSALLYNARSVNLKISLNQSAMTTKEKKKAEL